MTTVVLFGDSNTYGMPPMKTIDDIRRFPFEERWPGATAAALGDGWSIIEEGQPGRTTAHDDPIEGVHKNGLKHLPVILETHRPFDIIAIMLGTNDLRYRFSLTAEDIAASVAALVRTIQASPAGREGKPPRILIIAPPPILETGVLAGLFPGGREKSLRLGGLLEAVAQRFGTAYLDAGEHIVMDPGEGTHFTAEQHAILGAAVAGALKSMN